MKKILSSVTFRIVMSLAAIGFIFFSLRGKCSEAFLILRTEVTWSWFALAILMYLLGMVLVSIRLRYVFRVQDIFMSFKEVFYLSFVSLFFNLFLPSAVGGDIIKAYYAYKHTGKKLESTTSVLLDRLIGFVAMIVVAVAALLLFHKEFDDERVSRMAYGALAIMVISIFFFASKRFAKMFYFLTFLIPSAPLKKKVTEIYHAIYGYKKHHKILWASVALSFIGQSFFIVVYACLAQSLGVQIRPWIFFIIVPMIAIISMAPSLGGLGVREAGSIYMFKHFMTSERALALSLLLDILVYGYSFVAGLVYSLAGGLKSKTLHEMEELG